MALNPVEIFGQIGFVAGDGCLTRTLSAEKGASVVEIRDAATSNAPGPTTARFVMAVVNPDLPADWKGPDRLELRDTELADAVALAVADYNTSIIIDGGLPAEDLMFADDSTAYSNAFGDPQYGDWVGELDRERNVYVLRNPEAQYGKLYLDWRASIMAKAASGELGQLLTPGPKPAI